MQSPEMNADINVTTSGEIPSLERLQSLMAFAAIEEGLSGEVGIWLCTDDEIADLHIQFMDIPGATDVMSFPSGEESGGYLGDIAVSVDTARIQAADAGHSTEREVAYLCLHGFLHLAGYDDLDPDSRDVMLTRQDQLLSMFEQENPGDW
jgi:probable rRNA maturation factor